MDITGLAELALTAKTAMARQGLSIAMVKQQMQVDQAAVQLLTQATDQATQAASAASSGHIVDIVV
jgi:hypothetical protein